MEIKVIKRFRDKETNEVFTVGALYHSDDEERIKFLQSKGHLELSDPSTSNKQPDLLDQNVEEIKTSIIADLGKEQLEELFIAESNGKNRKGVIEHIDSLIKEG
jgi:hypothetical protein